jgi:hypothetical protein
MKRQSLFEFARSELIAATKDIRQKLFEEAWFGRQLSHEPSKEMAKSQIYEISEHRDFQEAWFGRDRGTPQRDDLEQQIDR